MAGTLKDVMARLPTGVCIVTARDDHGTPHGMTVNSFCSVSLDPPLVLVCLAKRANCFPVFARAAGFAVSILREHQVELARRFATSDIDKFGGGGFVATGAGALVVDDALAAVECRADHWYDAGDHVILVGAVTGFAVAPAGPPAVYFDRRFAALSAAPVPAGGGYGGKR